jgi:hypothetical protein
VKFLHRPCRRKRNRMVPYSPISADGRGGQGGLLRATGRHEEVCCRDGAMPAHLSASALFSGVVPFLLGRVRRETVRQRWDILTGYWTFRSSVGGVVLPCCPWLGINTNSFWAKLMERGETVGGKYANNGRNLSAITSIGMGFHV